MVRRKSVNSRRKKRKQRTYKGGIPVLSRLSRNRQERQIKNYNNNKDAREARQRKNMESAIEAAEVGKRNEIRQLLYDDTIGSNKLKNAASAEAREKDKIFFENHGLKYKPDKNVDNLRKSLERESKQQLKTLESLKEIELQKKKQSEKQFSNEQRSTIAQLDRTKNKLDYEIKEMKKKPITTEEFCDVDGNKLSSSCKKLDGLNNDLNKTTASKTQLTQPEKDYVEGKMNAAGCCSACHQAEAGRCQPAPSSRQDFRGLPEAPRHHCPRRGQWWGCGFLERADSGSGGGEGGRARSGGGEGEGGRARSGGCGGARSGRCGSESECRARSGRGGRQRECRQ